MSKDVTIEVDGKGLQVQSGITIKDALELNGYKITKYPEKGSLFVPCEVGGCWSCAVEVNQELKPTCVTPVKESLGTRTRLPKDFIPICGLLLWKKQNWLKNICIQPGMR